jgi:hypothetical protein
MCGKSIFLALASVASLVAPIESLARRAGDASVSGIAHGPGSIGGVNNSVNDQSGIRIMCSRTSFEVQIFSLSPKGIGCEVANSRKWFGQVDDPRLLVWSWSEAEFVEHFQHRGVLGQDLRDQLRQSSVAR